MRGMHRGSLYRFLALLLLLSLVISACAPAVTPSEPTVAEPAAPAASEATVPDGGSANEAPMLAEMVAAGELPPLEERLPTNPLVIEPIESIGQYGGTMRHPLVGSWASRLYSMLGAENLVTWTPLLRLAIPDGSVMIEYPENYMKQFHASYNTETLDQMVADAGQAGRNSSSRPRDEALPLNLGYAYKKCFQTDIKYFDFVPF